MIFSQESTPADEFYEAGVVEFAYERFENISADTRLMSYLDQYIKIMTDAPSNLDIIVFPEMTLNEFETAVEVPDVKDNVSPCVSDDYSSENVVKRISCAAKNFRRYVVVNIVTKVQCPDPEMIENKDPRSCKDRKDGLSYYNTNVVFDRNGTLISRYRKFNLFGEAVNKPYKPAMVVFETDFGIKFGHFICFDLMFRRPALELVRLTSDKLELLKDIQDIIFATMWFSELPFLTAVQVQQNWAYSNDVNLLAAGANNPEFGSTGTGIYSGRYGSIISVMEGSNRTTLYSATVPKKRISNKNQEIEHKAIRYAKEQMKPLTLKRDQLDSYKLQFCELLLIYFQKYFLTTYFSVNSLFWCFRKLHTEDLSKPNMLQLQNQLPS
jgi:predicted amidohydrolase